MVVKLSDLVELQWFTQGPAHHAHPPRRIATPVGRPAIILGGQPVPRPPLANNRVLVPTGTIFDINQEAAALATSVDYVNVRRLRTAPGRTAVMSASKFMYSMLEAYYAADERRRRSEEADYGVYWRLHGWEYRWRVSYVRHTGEIYAVPEGAMIGPVFMLSRVPSHPVGGLGRDSLFYRTLDDILSGWAEYCSRQDGLGWVGDGLSAAGVSLPSEPTG